jgi:hypothetical protein
VIQVTVWPDHSRATSLVRTPRPTRVSLVGDSFTQGWAVTNKETFAWKLQARFPDLEVVNHGVAGYSTHQALQRMKLMLKPGEQRPAFVLYGLNGGQPPRNVAAFPWLLALDRGARRGFVSLPYSSLDSGGRLRRHPPAHYPRWPLREISAAINAGEYAWERYVTQGRETSQQRVTEALVEEKSRVARGRGVELHVVFLDAKARDDYGEHLARQGVSTVTCTLPRIPGIVRGEGHPNGNMHTRWADCIDAALRPRLEEAAQSAR